MKKVEPIQNKYTFVFLISLKNGIINADPDTLGLPRMKRNGISIITNYAIKRRIRDYVLVSKEEAPGFKIYQKKGNILAEEERKAFASLGIESGKESVRKKKETMSAAEIEKQLRGWLCAEYFDIRAFGGAMTSFQQSGIDGQLRGPVKIDTAESVDPIDPQILSISRVTLTNKDEAAEKNSTFGTKTMIPYALYKVTGYIDASVAKNKSGLDEEDLNVLWNAILNMYEINPSASLGDVYIPHLYIFKHKSYLGNAGNHKLFEAVKITRKPGVDVAYDFSDYEVTVDKKSLPEGIELIEM